MNYHNVRRFYIPNSYIPCFKLGLLLALHSIAIGIAAHSSLPAGRLNPFGILDAFELKDNTSLPLTENITFFYI
ncbi:MAG TPA: hypothetical protein DCY97_05125 [Marinilabiliales bacterium]|nr:hypothetical protein [Marinilabiliales bacterium]